MNSTKVQNPRRKIQVALLAEPKTPLESSVFILYYEEMWCIYIAMRLHYTLLKQALSVTHARKSSRTRAIKSVVYGLNNHQRLHGGHKPYEETIQVSLTLGTHARGLL